MRPFRDSRKTRLAFPCFLEGRVCVHTACVCLQVCVCVCVSVLCVCVAHCQVELCSLGKGAEEEVVGLASPSTQFVEQLLHL